jgi:hypothetical protein
VATEFVEMLLVTLHGFWEITTVFTGGAHQVSKVTIAPFGKGSKVFAKLYCQTIQSCYRAVMRLHETLIIGGKL